MRVFFFLIALVYTFSLQAQDEYFVLRQNDDIVVSYKVVEVKKKGALLPQIRLSIENKSDKYINIAFHVNMHYVMEFIEAFEVSDMCIAPGKLVKGNIKGLFYNPESLTYDQLQSAEFEIVIEEVKVKKLDSCK